MVERRMNEWMTVSFKYHTQNENVADWAKFFNRIYIYTHTQTNCCMFYNASITRHFKQINFSFVLIRFKMKWRNRKQNKNE